MKKEFPYEIDRLCEEFDNLVKKHDSILHGEFNEDKNYKQFLNEVWHLYS